MLGGEVWCEAGCTQDELTFQESEERRTHLYYAKETASGVARMPLCFLLSAGD